jgi:hypothetical protein
MEDGVLPYLDMANCVVVMDGRVVLLADVPLVDDDDDDDDDEDEVDDNRFCCNASCSLLLLAILEAVLSFIIPFGGRWECWTPGGFGLFFFMYTSIEKRRYIGGTLLKRRRL